MLADLLRWVYTTAATSSTNRLGARGSRRSDGQSTRPRDQHSSSSRDKRCVLGTGPADTATGAILTGVSTGLNARRSILTLAGEALTLEMKSQERPGTFINGMPSTPFNVSGSKDKGGTLAANRPNVDKQFNVISSHGLAIAPAGAPLDGSQSHFVFSGDNFGQWYKAMQKSCSVPTP
jgi:hypothetical protein